MGTLAFTTLEDRASTDSTAVLNAVHGSAKAWAVYSQGVPTIRDSYNVDSISDDATGEWTVTFGTDFASTDYLVIGSVMDITTGVTNWYGVYGEASAQAVGTCGMLSHNGNATTNATELDASRAVVAFYGDQ